MKEAYRGPGSPQLTAPSPIPDGRKCPQRMPRTPAGARASWSSHSVLSFGLGGCVEVDAFDCAVPGSRKWCDCENARSKFAEAARRTRRLDRRTVDAIENA